MQTNFSPVPLLQEHEEKCESALLLNHIEHQAKNVHTWCNCCTFAIEKREPHPPGLGTRAKKTKF